MSERNRIPLKAKIAAIVALGGAAALAACGGKGNSEEPSPTQPDHSPVATERIPNPTAVPTEAPTVEPKPVSPEDAKPILSAPFVPTDFDTVKRSVDLAYERHPDAYNFKSQSLTFPKSEINSILEGCYYGFPPQDPPRADSFSCGVLVRVFYGHYMQSGYEEFYQAALSTNNFFLTTQPERRDEFVNIVLKSEFELNNLPLR